MKRLFALLCASASLTALADSDALNVALAAERARPAAPVMARDAFLARPAIEVLALSPDGRQLAYIQNQTSGRVVLLQSTRGGLARRVQAHSTVHSLLWSNDGQYLLLESTRALFAVPLASPNEARIVTTLTGKQRSLLAIDPVAPASVLLLERGRSSLDMPPRSRLLRVDMHGSRTLLYEDTHPINGVALARDGALAFLARVEAEHIAILKVTQRPGAQPQLRELARCERLERCTPLSLVNSAGELLLRADVDGDLYRLLRLDANGVLHTEHVDPRGEADLDELVLDPMTQQPLIASYRSTVPAAYGLTDEAQRQLAAIQRQLPQHDLRVSVGRGPDAMWLVEARDSTLQFAHWHLYDPRTRALRQILQLPSLAGRNAAAAQPLLPASLARKIAFSYFASDGMRLHGLLTVPLGSDVARVPLVANVHGGPWNHARPVYSNLTQLLANRGYAVFEANFRGSTGHGRDYLFAARGDYGNGRVQQDIVEGVGYLLARGIGELQHVGIVGASFGGYSTLLGVTFRPDLFRIGVAIVPPPDFAANLRWVARSSEALELANHVPLATQLRMLSLDMADESSMARLQSQSPLAHAARLERPLLLIASGEDRRVAISSVIEYAARLKLLGKDVSLLVDPDAAHSNTDPLAREAYFYLLESTLARYLGGQPASTPDPALRKYVDRNLSIRGAALGVQQ